MGYDREVPGSDAPDAPSTGPALAAGWPRRWPWRALVAIAVAGAAAGVGIAAWRLEAHYAGLAATEDLNWLGTLLANGSSPRTAWVGWVAALLFGLSALRVVRGRPEPPAGMDASASVSAMRAGLRRELNLVRCALTVVGLLTALDLGRAAATAAAAAGGDALARDRVAWVLVEAAGLVAATALLALWCAAFRRQCRDLGAL
jgi:hypothetical protein